MMDLPNNLFSREGIPIVPFNAKGDVADKNWRLLTEKTQTTKDLQLIQEKHPGAGPILGVKDLRMVEFTNPFIYTLFLQRFPELRDSFTVRTNDTIRLFVKSENGVKAVPSTGLGVKVHQQGPVQAFGLKDEGGFTVIETRGDKLVEYPHLIREISGWIWEVEEKHPWLLWPCIQRLMSKKKFSRNIINPIFNLILHYDPEADENLAISFFEDWPSFNEEIVRRAYRETRELNESDELKPPTCKYLRRNAGMKKKSCIDCSRPDEIRKDEFTLERIESLFKDKGRRIHHGQYFDPDNGLIYASRLPGFDEIAVVTKEGFFKGLPADYEGPKGDAYIIEGHTAPLFDSTIEDMLAVAKMTQEPHPELTLSSVYDEVLLRVVNHYLELRDPREAMILALWIIGTYMRQLFIWYPYITFYGLRDVGKSTALSVLSHVCFDGGGVISGSGTEATLLRSAESSKGLRVIDHYEVIRKSKDKKQVYEQFLENAWHLHTVAERTNANTMEVERFRIASSVAVASRYIDNVLEEKGIVFTMVDSADEDLKNRSSEIDTDPFFKDIRRRLMYVALQYAGKVFMKYHEIPEVPGLYGRDRNKFKPLLALALILEEEGKSGLFDEIADYGVEYRLARKSEVKDLEEALLMCIIENDLANTTYSELMDYLEDAGFDRVHWQTIRSDLKKLNIGFKAYKGVSQRSATVYVDLRRARERAIQRGLIKPVNGSDEDSGDDESVDENPHETRVNTPTDIDETIEEQPKKSETGGRSLWGYTEETTKDTESSGGPALLTDEPPNIRKTGMGEIEKRIIKELQDPDDPRLGTGVGSLTRRVSTDLMVDVEDVRKALMKLMRERVVEEPVMGYYKLVEYTEW